MSRSDGVDPDSNDTEKQPNLFQRIGGHVQRRTLAGLLELLPILVTAFVIFYIMAKADEFIRPLVRDLPPEYGRNLDFPGIGIILAIIVFYLVGLIISVGFGRRLMGWMSEILRRLPVVKGVYGVTLQATSAITSQYNFSRVVFLEWPREGMIAMGFVTARVRAPATSAASASGVEPLSLAIVYIPTVPNPTSGNMALVVEDDLFETDLSVEDAMKLIFSGGIVPPDEVSLARLTRERQDVADFIGQFETDRDR